MDQNILGHGIILTKLIPKEMTNPKEQKFLNEESKNQEWNPNTKNDWGYPETKTDFSKNDGVKHGK